METIQLLPCYAVTMKLKLLLIFTFIIVAGCSSDNPTKIGSLINQRSTEIDFSSIAVNNWTKLCVFAPYAYNKQANNLLGFDWDLEGETNIEANEGISVLVLVNSEEVIEYTEVNRKHADFAHLGGQCFLKNETVFIREGTDNNWPKWKPKT